MNGILLFGMPGLSEWVIILIGLVVFLAFSALWLYALVDCVRSEFADNNTRLIWILAIIFISPIGPILYVVIGRKQRVNRQGRMGETRF